MEDDLSSIRLQLQMIKENLSMTNELTQQVNLDKFQQLESSINTTQTQLGVSVDQLNQQLDTVATDLIPQLNSSLNSQQASLLALNSSIRMDLMQHSDPLELQRLRPGQTRYLHVFLSMTFHGLLPQATTGSGLPIVLLCVCTVT
jgi:hypothetical protein